MELEKTAEAVRWREMALEKMRETDFISARRLAIEAQKLCPAMEDIDRMILVCNVHCSAADGKDWYKILDVAAEAGEAAVRSRCGRMAIGLHPDRNRFPGAAEAFQLMVEAKAVLLDNEKRRVYDSMCRAKAMEKNWGFSRFIGDGVGEGFQSGFSRFRNGCEGEIEGFGMNCGRDKGFQEQSLYGSAGLWSFEEHYQQGQIGQASGENQPNCSRGRGRGRGKGRGRESDLSKQCNNEGLMVNISNESVVNLDVDQPSGENRPSSRGRGIGRGRGRGRESKLSKHLENEGLMMNSSKKDVVNSSTIRETRLSKKCKIEGQMMNNISNQNVINLDIGSSIVQNDHAQGENRSKSSTIRGSKLSKIEGLALNSSSKETMVNLDSRPPNDEPNSRNRPNVRGRGRCRGPSKRSKKGKWANEITPDSSILEYKDAEFNDFEKQRCIATFAAGQIWAVYDTLDAMPRFYALINEVSSDHTVHMTWLEPLPNNEVEKEWLNQGLPTSCGRFRHGYPDMVKDVAVFSHLVKWKSVEFIKNVYEIQPKKGETWAVFKNWDGNPLKLSSFECEVVEILSDFSIVFGVSVGFLRRIEGFCCVFGRKLGKGVDWEVIKGKDRLRFSHRIPSILMDKSYFELDPASLPRCIIN